jgi:hypothetical protein
LTGKATQCGAKTIKANTALNVSVAGFFSVPSTATALVVNVTAILPTGAGYLTVYPAGQTRPTASNLNVTAGAVVANLVEVGVGSGGAISVYASTTSDVAIDLQGYVNTTASGGTGSGLYNALPAPVRICDTRPGNPSKLTGSAMQCNNHTLAAGGHIPVAVAGSFGVPSGAIGVVANVTAVAPAAGGYLTVFPDGVARPTVSNVNYRAGQVIPNRVTATLGTAPGSQGKLDVFSSQTSDVIVDISGYYTAAGGTGSIFVSEPAPLRICDTRPHNPSGLSGPAGQCNGPANTGMALGAGRTQPVQVAGQFGVPSGATAAVINVTGIQPTQSTYLTVYPGGTRPVTSDLNPAAGGVEPNLVVATLSVGGAFIVYNNTGSINLAVDLSGWYQLSATVPGPPSLFLATPGNTQVALTWTTPPNGGSPLEGYNVFEGTSPGGEPAMPINGGTLITTTSFTATGLTNGTTYYFTVEAVNAVGSSPPSNELSATPPLPPLLRWSAAGSAEPPEEQWSAISCPSTAFCAAVGGPSGDVSTYSAATGNWTSPAHIDSGPGTGPAQSVFLNQVSCTSSTLCVAVDTFNGSVFHYNGSVWSPDASTVVPFLAVSCSAGAAFCMAVDSLDHVFTSTDGVTWAPAAALAANDSAAGLTCLSSTSCLALVGAVSSAGATTYTTYRWDGATWSPGGSLPSTTVNDSVQSFSCASTTLCFTSLFDLTTSSFLIYQYGGATWSPAAPLPAGDSLNGPIACAPGGDCFTVAAGTGGPVFLESTGGPWSQVPNGAHGTFFGGGPMSCAGAAFCGVASGGNQLSVFNGASWTTVSVGWGNQVEAVSCATSRFCVAVDNGGDYVSFDGTSWSAAAPVAGSSTIPTSFFGLDSISCPAAGSCAAVDTSGNVWRYSAGVWSSPPPDHAVVPAPPLPTAAGISCTTAGICGVVSTGTAATYNPTAATWTATAIDSNQDLNSVSCTSASFCVAVDAFGFYSTWNGVSWSPMAIFDPQGSTFPFSTEEVSCASPSLCVATGSDGNAEVYNGTTWSNPNPLALFTSLGNPSCVPAAGALSAYCVVNTLNRIIYLQEPGGTPTWSPLQPLPPNNGDLALALGCARSLCVATGFENEAWVGTPTPGAATSSRAPTSVSSADPVLHEVPAVGPANASDGVAARPRMFVRPVPGAGTGGPARRQFVRR